MAKLELVREKSKTQLAGLVDDYLADLHARGRARRTLSHYEMILKRILLTWSEAEGIREAAQLDQRALNRLSSEMLEEGSTRGQLSRASIHGYTRTINQFLAWARAEGAGGTGKGHLPKLERKVLDVLSREEIRRMEDAAHTERDRLMVRLLGDTGIRLGELLKLRLGDLVEHGRERYIRVNGKGSQERLVPLAPQLYQRLRRYAERGRPREAYTDRIFTVLRRSPDGTFPPLQPRTFQETVKAIADEAGISKRVYVHLLRHSFATNALRKGMNPLQLQRILGHADLAMISKTYSHLTVSDSHTAMMALLRADDAD